MHELSAGIPTDNRACRIQHQNCVLLNSVKERPIFFFTVAECYSCQFVFHCVMIRTPPGERRDQQAHAVCEDHQSPNQPQAPFCVCIPQFQQSKLFAPQIADQPLKLIVEHIIRPVFAASDAASKSWLSRRRMIVSARSIFWTTATRGPECGAAEPGYLLSIREESPGPAQ